jgi:hypothetical protein
MSHHPARTVTIGPDRLRRWIEGFRARHGTLNATLDGDAVCLTGTDGAEARITVPFPPLAGDADIVDDLLRHVTVPRRVGALLVRKGGYAVGVFDGHRLIASKVGSAYVQGKTKAGGWSQQRYARRRDNQSKRAYEEAAHEAVRVLVPHLGQITALATGGDKAALRAVLADPLLADLRPLVLDHVEAVPDPRLRVLQAFAEQFLAVAIELNDLA